MSHTLTSNNNKMKITTWTNLPESERQAILTQVAEKYALPENAIEKDYWVSMVLRALFNLPYKENLIFKGGTSLSKGWHLIERFSEDIDLAINPAQFGFEGTTFGKSKRDKLRRTSKTFVETELKDKLTEELEEAGLGKHIKVESEETKVSDKDPMVLYINYKSILKEKRDYIYEKVKLEISCRSMIEPSEKLRMRSMIADSYPEEPFAESGFEVNTADPRRTFLEKVFLLHEEFNRPGGCTRLDRITRHMYDIVRMMDKDFAKEVLSDATLYTEIVRHRSVMTSWHGMDYKTHHPSTINFIPPEKVIPILREDYKKMQDNFIYGDSPSFDELIEKLKELQERFHNQTWSTDFFTDAN